MSSSCCSILSRSKSLLLLKIISKSLSSCSLFLCLSLCASTAQLTAFVASTRGWVPPLLGRVGSALPPAGDFSLPPQLGGVASEEKSPSCATLVVRYVQVFSLGRDCSFWVFPSSLLSSSDVWKSSTSSVILRLINLSPSCMKCLLGVTVGVTLRMAVLCSGGCKCPKLSQVILCSQLGDQGILALVCLLWMELLSLFH